MNNYVQRLKLNYDPFEPGAVARDFYYGGRRQTLLDQLVEQCLYGSTILSVTGCLGSGKSTLARQFCNSFDEEAVTVLVPATLFMNRAQFLDAFLEQLPLEQSAIADNEVVPAVREYARRLDMEAKSLNLVVDDAHELSSEVLELILAMLGHSSEAGIHVLLLGESQLSNMLHSLVPTSQSETLLELELEGLGSDETLEYVKFKLANAGYDQQLPLAVGVLGDIHNDSGGMPGTIHTLLRDALATKVVGMPEPDSGSLLGNIPLRYVAVAGGLLGILLFMVMQGDSGDPQSGGLADSGTGSSGGGERIQIPISINASGDNSTSQTEVSQFEPSLEPAPLTITTPPDEPLADRVALLEEIPQEIPEEIPQEISEEIPQEVSEEIPQEILEEAEEIITEISPADPISVVTAERAPSSAGLDTSEFEQQLLAYAESSFTVQMMGSFSESNVQGFIDADLAAASGSNSRGYFETRFQDRPWYVVVLGNFENRDAATATIQSLPESLRSLQPWVRSLADIQSDIRQLRNPD